MSDSTPSLPKKTLPERLRRELRQGETIWHSTSSCHVSNKFPEGKWMAQTRRQERGQLVKYPIKGFGTPQEALEYLKSLRPDQKGNVYAPSQGEPTVADLYEFVTKHRQKGLSEQTKSNKKGRWEMYIQPAWGACPISMVTQRLAQEWITEIEEDIEDEEDGAPGLPTFQKIRTDLHALFEGLPSFSPRFEDRRNPFANLDFVAPQKRRKVTMESQHFPAIYNACEVLITEGLCTRWIAEQFLTSLLSGLRFGEVFALCEDQLNFEKGAIIVDRSMRRNRRGLDPVTRIETGPIVARAMYYPKGGSPTVDKTRVVPMSDQLAKLLKQTLKRERVNTSGWELLWPSTVGTFRELTRFTTAWNTLRGRLNELATLAPLKHKEGAWPVIPKHRGHQVNPFILEARKKKELRIPDIFGAIDFRDTRNSFASYMNEVGISQATREHILGHAEGITNAIYTEITSGAFQDARKRLSEGWKPL